MPAAEFAFVSGHWNEYVPKAGLLMLLTPIVLGGLAIARKLNLSAIFLSVVFLLGCGDLLWNGLADAYLAL